MKTNELIEEVKRCSEQLDKLKSKRDRLVGQKDQLLNDMKDKFGVSTIEEAEELIGKLEEKLEDDTAVLEQSKDKMNKIIEKANA